VSTEDIILHIFYHVDNAMLEVEKPPLSKLYPSEVVTIGRLFALKGGHFRAFYRWLTRDYDALFGGLPERCRNRNQLITFPIPSRAKIVVFTRESNRNSRTS
jgi:hypothetical protein